MFNANLNSIFISAYSLPILSFAHPQQRNLLRPPADEASAEHCVRASQPAGRARRDLARRAVGGAAPASSTRR